MITDDIWFDLWYELQYDIWYGHNTEQNDHADPDDSAIETYYGYGYECEYWHAYSTNINTNWNYMIICDIGFDLWYELRYDIWYSHNTEQNDHADPDDSDIEP